MAIMFRAEKKPGDILTADDYNTDVGLPLYRIRVYAENISLNTQTRTREVARVMFPKPILVYYVTIVRQVMHNVTIRNLEPEKTIGVEIGMEVLARYRGELRSNFSCAGFVVLRPGEEITLDASISDTNKRIDNVIDEMVVTVKILPTTWPDFSSIAQAEAFIPKTWITIDL
jgi:hypothetical protein